MSMQERDPKLENGPEPTADSDDPSAFLGEITGQVVTVKLNTGIVFTGNLNSVDGYMNIALEGCREYVDGNYRGSLGDTFIRGNNVEYVSRGKSEHLRG
ncbi:LSM-domain-containing protein [Sporormia fimetaria CBS 119925]|uniref:U6 snRNA-associated Sm-like protein LSm6 n=1 Tax=Sporormia fimetaria CBS 119925 TaxID=1340428 RepID=A0A6A6VI53_9PLEO|nr:LSM-domain-containing protein [Sporormia fimetaria CBS 119925]